MQGDTKPHLLSTNESNHERPSYLAKQNTNQERALPANGARHLASRVLLRSPD